MSLSKVKKILAIHNKDVVDCELSKIQQRREREVTVAFVIRFGPGADGPWFRKNGCSPPGTDQEQTAPPPLAWPAAVNDKPTSATDCNVLDVK